MEQQDAVRALFHHSPPASIEVGWRKLAASLRRGHGRRRARHAENEAEHNQNGWENTWNTLSHDFNPYVDVRASGTRWYLVQPTRATTHSAGPNCAPRGRSNPALPVRSLVLLFSPIHLL